MGHTTRKGGRLLAVILLPLACGSQPDRLAVAHHNAEASGPPAANHSAEQDASLPVRDDLRALMNLYLRERLKVGTPLPWQPWPPHLDEALGDYRLVEVALHNPFGGAAQADSLTGLLVAPRVGNNRRGAAASTCRGQVC